MKKSKIKPSSKVVAEIHREYKHSKENWLVCTSFHDKLFNQIIHHDNTLWLLKSKPISPVHYLGLGISIKRDEIPGLNVKKATPLNFASLHPLSRRRAILMYGRSMHLPDGVYREILVEDPFMKEIDAKLTQKLKRLFEKLYPERASIYI